MAPIDRRLRAWAWLVRRQASIASKSEAEVIALQARHAPDNAVTNYIFGKVAPGTEVSDRTIPGPGGDLTVRVYRPVRPPRSRASRHITAERLPPALSPITPRGPPAPRAAVFSAAHVRAA